MRRPRLLIALVLLVAGCAPGPATGGRTGTVHLLVAGTVDLSGRAGAVAGSDPEGLLREVRYAARRADLAVVLSADDVAAALLRAAGFDAVVCPHPRSLAAAGAAGEVGLRCAASPGRATTTLGAPSLAVRGGGPPYSRSSADVTVGSSGEAPAGTLWSAPPGRTRLAISGLGALLSGDRAAEGALLGVLVDGRGVIAYRLGRVAHPDFRAHFAGWGLPSGDAVLLDGEWWTLVRPIAPAPVERPPATLVFSRGDLVAASLGDVTGDGRVDLAASYRHPFRPSALSEAYDGAVGVDAAGRSAHMGVFATDGEALWAAGYLPRPVGDLAACDGSVALAYTALDDPAVVATGAAVWQGHSLRPAPELPGAGSPGCADVDGDGRLDPVILGRPD